MKFSKDEISSIMYDDGISDENGNALYTVVQAEVIDNDSEKNRITRRFVIKDEQTGLFYCSTLDESPWYKQAEANANSEWYEVKAYQKIVTDYR